MSTQCQNYLANKANRCNTAKTYNKSILIRHFGFLLLLCFAVLGSFGTSFASELIFIEKRVRTLLNTDNSKYKTYVAEYDLNNDGEVEYIVKTVCNPDDWECPRVSYPNGVIYDVYNKSLLEALNNKDLEYTRSLLSVGGFSDIKVLNTTHNKYFDIAVQPDAKSKKYLIFEFNEKYKSYSQKGVN